MHRVVLNEINVKNAGVLLIDHQKLSRKLGPATAVEIAKTIVEATACFSTHLFRRLHCSPVFWNVRHGMTRAEEQDAETHCPWIAMFSHVALVCACLTCVCHLCVCVYCRGCSCVGAVCER